MRGQLRIEQMFAFVLLDEDGTEGVPAFRTPSGMQIPMVSADMKHVDSLRPIAQDLARKSGRKITLCRFEIRTDLEVIE